MVECQLPKLNTGVRFPSPAPKGHAGGVSFLNGPFQLVFGYIVWYNSSCFGGMLNADPWN